jgi:hypothetical protein
VTRRLVLALFSAACLAGCSGRNAQPSDNATVLEQDSQGVSTAGKSVVDPSTLGIPVYPTTIASDTEGYVRDQKGLRTWMVVMATDDSFEKVAAWYKSQMPAGSQTTYRDDPQVKVASFDETDANGTERGVQISGGAKTSIMLTVDAKE